MAGVQSFLEFNDIVLNWKKIAKYYPEPVYNNLRAYTREAMQQKYEQEMSVMREQVSQIMLMIQQNTTLAQVKPEALLKKGL